jgi:hypothetical protein
VPPVWREGRQQQRSGPRDLVAVIPGIKQGLCGPTEIAGASRPLEVYVFRVGGLSRVGLDLSNGVGKRNLSGSNHCGHHSFAANSAGLRRIDRGANRRFFGGRTSPRCFASSPSIAPSLLASGEARLALSWRSMPTL